MRILLTGKNGQLGWELNRSLMHLGPVEAFDRRTLDLSRPQDLAKTLDEIRPDVIVNAAAYTAVDKAEEEESLATTVNGVSPGVLAEVAKQSNALLVHFSTDYVFDGTKDGVYTESDTPNPLNAYGRSKLAGEQAVRESGCDYLLFRTSWVYASRGQNFLQTILRLAGERDRLAVVGDQHGSPTCARLIADVTSHCIGLAQPQRQSGSFDSGLYHLTSSGSTSWHGFAEEIICRAADRLSVKPRVRSIDAIPSVEYPTPAERPKNSRLTSQKLERAYNLVMPDWTHCLELCLEEMS